MTLNISLKEKIIPKEILRLIPQESAAFYKFIPFAKERNILKVAMLNPEDFSALEALKFISQHQKLKPEVYQVSQVDFIEAIKQYSNLSEEVSEALEDLEREAYGQKKEEKSDVTLRSLSQEAPITKAVAVILRHAVEGGASDIHIEVEDKEVRVRFRVDGILHASLILPKKVHLAIISRIKILARLKIDETRKPQDGRFRVKINDKQIDFRVSSLPTKYGEKIVMRLLDVSAGLFELRELGLRNRNLEVVQDVLKKTTGLILVTGPTGSGKSTTLYALLKILNKEAVNIITLEDPVEYWISGVNQSQVRPEIGYTFASGLRSILRQDPDIIMVGEIRDKETAELAVHAALTGHVVLSTLHTNNALGAIPRLLDMGIEPFLLVSSLNLVIAQRLARMIEKAGPKKPANKEIQALFEKEFKNSNKIKFPIVLPEVKKERGRMGIFEVLEITPGMEQIINHNLTEKALSEEAEKQGMTAMLRDGLLKAIDGLIGIKEVLRVVQD